MKIYGTLQCKDCVACVQALEQAGIAYAFCDIQGELSHLKAFLKLRDALPLFAAAKAEGKIGIPCVVLDDGTITLDWQTIFQTL